MEVFQQASGDNTIKTGSISMYYTESSNVINITNALPMTDEDGKKQTNYFDFSITSNAETNADDNEGIKIPYNLIIEPKVVDADKDALTNEQIKVYLTKIESETEVEVLDSIKISELTAKDTNFNLYSAENIHKNGSSAITTKYRLRAWIDYGVESSDFNTKTYQYKFAVNVNATGKINDATVTTKNVPNPPLLTSNMIPVYYDESDDKWKKADSTNANENYKWYDYNKKMWANAVTVNDTNRATYLSASAGTPIEMEDINAMFVWIPRYKYTYFSSATPVEIPITFEKGTSSTGTIKCTDAIVVNSGKSETCTDTTNGSITKGISTYTHPAFTFGDTELTGIWVGKFETGGDDASIIKANANVTTQRIYVSTFFQHSRNMELANNIYGFPQSGTVLNTYTGEITGDSNNLDTHMMKNMEWGAVAYLSHSKYGTCTDGTCIEVGINNYHDSDLLTGCGAEVGSDSSNVCNAYNTTEGQKASTTRNIYGVYDMSGGGGEYVMANMTDENNAFYPESSRTWTITETPLNKYYDKYSYGTSEVEYTRGKLGDSTIELQPSTGSISAWYDDCAQFLTAGTPWFSRGGIYYKSIAAGMFNFGFGTGQTLIGASHTVVSVASP